VVDLNRKDWAVRGGFFQAPSAPNNSDVLNCRPGGTVIEFEERHTIFDQPGKLRLGAFVNAGQHRLLPAGAGDRRGRPHARYQRRQDEHPPHNRKCRYFANLEQQLVTNVACLRAS